jgi:DNA-binding MarR family transcriptional regulator
MICHAILPRYADPLRSGARRLNTASANFDPDQDVLTFLDLLWAMDHGLNLVSKRMLATMGVTGPQRVVIRLIGRCPGLTAGEIADQAHQDRSTLSVILRRLEENGLVTRTGDPDDLRRVRLHLTPSGKKVDEQQDGTVESAVRQALGRLGPRQASSAMVALRVLAQELEYTARRE